MDQKPTTAARSVDMVRERDIADDTAPVDAARLLAAFSIAYKCKFCKNKQIKFCTPMHAQVANAMQRPSETLSSRAKLSTESKFKSLKAFHGDKSVH